jgi:C-terminal processing protease CtpA/Prc
VVYLISHFFAEGDNRHLNDIYERRTNTTRQYWTNASVGPRYSQPIYVLISPQTYSGGEECAYDLQAQKRATLVGETTGGAANPGEYIPLTKGFIAFIPTGRPINPVTSKNWEHVAVKPDIAASADTALKAAYTAILRGFIQKASDPHEREELNAALEGIDSVVADLPMHGSQH